jgi:hypothetical protein
LGAAGYSGGVRRTLAIEPRAMINDQGGTSVALGFYFKPQSFNKDRYDELLQRLEQAGAGSPPGRSYHFAFTGQDGGIEVFDAWESQESFETFGETLVPILNELDTDPGEPQVAEIHNIILG